LPEAGHSHGQTRAGTIAAARYVFVAEFTQGLTGRFPLSILGSGKGGRKMSDTIVAGDDGRLGDMDDSLPVPPESDDDAGYDYDADEIDQPEPEEVSDAVLDS
jgi:hypothetical protein